MSSGSDPLPTDALEDIAYLSRSENRIQMLDALASGPHTRRELSELTGVSRATVGRITIELEERGWAERVTAGDYVATSTGKHVVAQFTPFIESIAAILRLGEVVEWLPADELSIGLQHFSDATVIHPEQDDPMTVIDYFADLIRGATEFHTLTHFAPPPEFAEEMRDGLLTTRLTVMCVLTEELVGYLCSRPERSERWRDCIEAGADVYRYEGHIPCNLFVIDEKVLIKKSAPGSVQQSYGVPIVSSNETVRKWACELIETYKVEAESVDGDTFADAPSVSDIEADDS